MKFDELRCIFPLSLLQMFNTACLVCSCSFGVQDQYTPYVCTGTNCNQNYCRRCLDWIRKYNGPRRPFRCMCCLLEYARNTAPIENVSLIQKLWDRAVVKYGFLRQQDSTNAAVLSQRDLQFEIECRHYHLRHLLRTLEQLTNWGDVESAFDTRRNANGMLVELTDILRPDQANIAANNLLRQSKYCRIITRPNHPVGSSYIELCERLNAEIADAEIRCLFPTIHNRSNDWNDAFNATDVFQPKIREVFAAIERDIRSFPTNAYYRALRTKIGFIGYTSSGKTSLMYRLLEIRPTEHNEFFPVRTTKSTYCSLQYDRNDPLISPDENRTATAVKFIDIQGCDRGRNIDSGVIEAGNYLDEIQKADCDIYVLVFNEELDPNQHQWMIHIEQCMQRRCVLVRSKVDITFLEKFREEYGMCYGASPLEEQNERSQRIIDDIRRDFAVEGHHVYLTAACYYPTSTDATILLQRHSFDIEQLLVELSRLAPLTRKIRVQNLACRAISRVINSCFRTGYVIKILHYKIAAGVTNPLLFADRATVYLAERSVERAIGITEDFLGDLARHAPLIIDQNLETSVFEQYVTVSAVHRQPRNGNRYTETSQRQAAVPDVPVVKPVVETGRKILGYINRLCNDLIKISMPMVSSMMHE